MAEAEAKKSFLNMLGEFCRETAVLTFVFGNLDFWSRLLWGRLDDHFHGPTKSQTTSWTLEVFGLTIVFGLLGYLFERWRKT
jgi:hypothetical protein